ncbi:MAG: MOSC domain-containing protein [Candidatus Eisenbacteria bacterium]|nr:MOSC domain-containing protein [Candidatus Eisenbacteria bacterium]
MHPLPEWDRGERSTWRSAYGKDEVAGPVFVGALGLDGDEQAHLDVHGGPQMAVLAYAQAHYAHWREVPGLERMGPGGFAENLTLDGPFDELEGLIEAGDTYRLVERPQPEWTIARVFRARVRPDRDAGELRALTTLPGLSPEWHGHFRHLLERA